MPILLSKHTVAQRTMLRDVRPVSVIFMEMIGKPDFIAMSAFGMSATFILASASIGGYADLIFLFLCLYFRWGIKRPIVLPFKLPRYANMADPNNPPPGRSKGGKSDGILFIGNVSDAADDNFGRELWLTNTDARTHILYLGTTGSGKTEGLKSMVANALAWGSGFSYTDGKADTDLWASLYAMARRFGRDDDIFVLNYMTGNADDGATSNTMNPFSNGSASYLANMITSFMPDAGGDNAMWKERAVALMFALMPALTFKRDKQGLLLDVGVVRDYIELQPIIRLSRDPNLPERIVHGLQGYLNTLPGFVDAAFDDEGNERPPSPDQPMYDLQVARQQHGYLSMQFTRSLQSLADEYGYIFKAQLADIDVLDIVLNRRIVVVLIPALEKSGDEAANLGKIVAASLKGMMGATLGNTVEGSWESAIGSKQTHSASSFMTVFDEVGYYTAQGMAVMAAQARSLGFSLVFASQDLPSMEKRVKQEAKSIVGNCNLKILGRIEDPTDTKEFVQRHGGTSWVMETKGMTAPTNTVSSLFMNMPFYDERGASYQNRQRVDYDHLRGQREGEAHLLFGDWAVQARMFHAVPERVKALRVHRLLPVPGTTSSTAARERAMNELNARLKDPEWTAAGAGAAVTATPELAAMAKGIAVANAVKRSPVETGIMALASLAGTAAKPAEDAGTEKPAAKTPPVAAPSNGKSAAHAKPENGGIVEARVIPANIPEISPAEKASLRAHLPPLLEGDQFAITETDYAASSSGKAPTSSLSATEADLGTVMPRSASEDATDILATKLPDDVSAMLEESAKKLNKGLTGQSEDR
ncbi:MAG: TraM recognition domain-containing protein [Alphaproteobacteria bacterium]|nr:TraM recognition domain-containing protein [Alphaproteobacteria bacterium]